MTTPTKAILGLAAALTIGATAAGCGYLSFNRDAYVATVNGHKIAVQDYNQALEQAKKQYGAQFGVDFNSTQGKQMLAGIQKNIVQQLVDRELLLSEAEKRGLKATQTEIDSKLAELKKQFHNDADFQKALTDNGLTLDELKHRVAKGLSIEKLQKDATKGLAVTEAQVADYYKQHKEQFTHGAEISASHILIKFDDKAKDPAKDDARALAKIKELQAQIKHGADFAKLAGQNSDDPGSKTQGGSLGFFSKGRMVPEFEKAAFALKEGQVSEPVKSKFGYHLIKRGGSKPASVDALSAVAKQIQDQLVNDQRGKAFQGFVASLKKGAQIVVRPEYQPKDEPAEKK